MKRSRIFHAVIGLSALLTIPAAQAQYTVQVGGLYLDPGASAGNTTHTGSSVLSLNVKPVTTVFFSVARELDPHWDLQLSLGYPPTHDVTLRVVSSTTAGPYDGQKIGTVRQIAPTLFANYKWGEKSSAFRPFVGIGINYTMFDQVTSNTLGDTLNGGTTTGKLDDSWGLAAQIGGTYRLDRHWTLNGSISTADVNTTLTTNANNTEHKTKIKFTPAAYIVGIGYTF